MIADEDLIQVGTTAVASESEYADERWRSHYEQRARHKFTSYLTQSYLALLDAPRGKWERVPWWTDSLTGEQSFHWEYRLLGICVTKETMAAQS